MIRDNPLLVLRSEDNENITLRIVRLDDNSCALYLDDPYVCALQNASIALTKNDVLNLMVFLTPCLQSDQKTIR